MRYRWLILFFIIFFQLKGQDTSKKWAFSFGVNFVDLIEPNETFSRISKDYIYSNRDWNFSNPYSITFSRYFKKGISLAISASTNDVDCQVCREIDSERNTKKTYFSYGIDVRYYVTDLLTTESSWKQKFVPYISLGFGQTRLASYRPFRSNLRMKWGIQIWIINSLGIYFDSCYKTNKIFDQGSSYLYNSIGHFQHTLGIIFKVGKSKKISKSRKKTSQKKYKLLQDKNKTLGKKGKLSQDKNKALGKKGKLSQDKNKALGKKGKLSQDKNKALGKKDKLSQDKNKALGKKGKLLQDKNKALGKKGKLLQDKNKALGKKGKLPRKTKPLQKPFKVKKIVKRPSIKKQKQVFKRLYNKRLKILCDAVNFDYKRYKLNQKTKKALDKIAVILLKYPDLRFAIQGHTDNIASLIYNILLSFNRANEVKKCLISKGIPEKMLIVRAYGFYHPVSTNKTDKGRSLNRRVEIVLDEITID